ncbi:TonB-dependent receptor [Croceicoccus ponticola]|uniref:TonB-dependent receptor n=1 Tax=Croceicoccus ponticola TaxID=2217664 RepID=A0A437H258_9SPHN|nr:TonB-dependent receptor [Croceicoccus ponticola]RVQ69679.1 TonB-dependent receptor [Croceicoccus ponticola]
MQMNKKRFGKVLLLTSSLIGWAVPVRAQEQEAGAGSSPSAAETQAIITVVATRREQALQDVPLAVTAVGEDALRLNQVDTISDIGTLTPNMMTVAGTAGGAKSAPQFSLRGQSQQERGGLSDASVSVYLGDVAIARTQGLNQSLFDVRAVEVIRGPVGTLFGKNATGGAVIIRPNLPTTDGVEGSVGVTLAEFGTINGDATINVPLSDSAALRLGGAFATDDGYIFDETLNRNVNDTKTYSLRGSLLLRSGAVENVTMVNYFNEDDGGSGGFARFLNPNGSIAVLAGSRNYRPVPTLLAEQEARGDLRINNGVPEFNDVKTIDIQNTTTFDVNDSITFKNIFGWRKVDSHILVDLDGTEHPLLHTEIFDDSEQISNEFQLFGSSGDLDWIAGSYYFNETGDNNASSIILGTENGGIEASTMFVDGATNNRQKFDNTSVAIFAEGTYELLDGLSLTLGGRYTWDKREALILNRRINTRCGFTIDDDGDPTTPEINPGDGPNCRVDASGKFDAFTYNVALNYKPDTDTLLYASLRRGFRSGGFAARASAEVGLRRPFKPEFVRNIELGLKRDWHLGGAFLQTNVAIFHSKYTDVQRQAVDTTSNNPFTVVINAAEATIKGIEAEVVFRPVDRLQLSGFWGYTDASFDKFIDPFTGNDLSNQKFARVPKNNWRIAGTADLVRNADIGDISFTAAYSGRDSYLDSDNSVAPWGVIPSHAQLDLYLKGDNVAGSGFDVTLFAKNVTDTIAYQPLASVYTSLGFAAVVPGAPRQFGLQLRYDF